MSNNCVCVDVNERISKFPEQANTLIVDSYLHKASCSSRVYRLYANVPKHYHKTCEEMLYLLQGKAKIYIENEEPQPAFC